MAAFCGHTSPMVMLFCMQTATGAQIAANSPSTQDAYGWTIWGHASKGDVEQRQTLHGVHKPIMAAWSADKAASCICVQQHVESTCEHDGVFWKVVLRNTGCGR